MRYCNQNLIAYLPLLAGITVLLYAYGLFQDNLPQTGWLERSGVNKLHALGLSGKGVNVALIDSGVTPHHKQLAHLNIVNSFNVHTPGELAIDRVGHGTQVVGVLSSKLFGVAPEINLTVLKAGDTVFYERDRAKAISQVAKNDDIKLLLINVGGGENKIKDEFLALLEYSKNEKVKVVVMPAGNGGGAIPVAPAVYANVLHKNSVVVGALDEQGEIAEFSNRPGAAKKRFILASGSNISTIDLNNTYKTVSGTSFAAPIVTGIIALLMEAFPDIEPAVILDYLFLASTDMGAAGVDEIYGNGQIDAYKTYLLIANSKKNRQS